MLEIMRPLLRLIWVVNNMSEKILELIDFHYYYGGIHAVKGVNMHVDKNEMVAFIGTNGAGKTTILRAISGFLPNRNHGKIIYKGQIINKAKPHEITKMGIAQAMEGREVFPQLTVKENLQMGAFLRNDKEQIKKDFDYIYGLLPRLKERENQMAGTLSGGEQQMLAIARALLINPDILLLDEPSLGLAPLIVKEVYELIEEIKKKGMTILLIEQNSKVALNSSDRAYVIDTGNIVIEGDCKELLNNDMIKKTYLGED